MQNYIQPGRVLTFTAPAGGVKSGVGVKVGQLFVVPAADAAAGTMFEGKATGVFALPKLSAQAWTEGQLIYWDAANDRCTSASAAGLLPIGCAAAAAANPSTSGLVRLNGTAVASVP